jgi:hypothetical protein
MELYEIPKQSLYNGEGVLPLSLRGDRVASDQWLFERHYANSEFALGVPFRDRFFRGLDMMQYQFFRGDSAPPAWVDPQAYGWWSMERDHWKTYGINFTDSPYVLYFREWVYCKAAPNSNFDLWSSPVNPWLDRYLEFAPMSPAGF